MGYTNIATEETSKVYLFCLTQQAGGFLSPASSPICKSDTAHSNQSQGALYCHLNHVNYTVRRNGEARALQCTDTKANKS